MIILILSNGYEEMDTNSCMFALWIFKGAKRQL